MKKQLLFSVFLFISLTSFGQNQYAFTQHTESYTNLSGSTLLNDGTSWDDPMYTIPIGFTFSFFDQDYDEITVSDKVFFNEEIIINVFTADLIDRDSLSSSPSPISYLLDISATDTILKIEWKNAGFYDESNLGTTDDYVNVQLWLYHGTNDIEIRIGPNSVLNEESYGGYEGALIGLANGTNYFNLMGNASAPIMGNSEAQISGTPSNGTVFKFAQLVGIDQEEINKNNVNIYPNPATEKITVDFTNTTKEETLIEVYNIMGDVIYQTVQKSNINKSVLNVSAFRSGAYYVKLSNASVTLTKPFLVVN